MYFLTLNSVYGNEVVVNMALVETMDTEQHGDKPCSVLGFSGSENCVRVYESLNEILQALPPGSA